jgi:high affinity Mn2+ porin
MHFLKTLLRKIVCPWITCCVLGCVGSQGRCEINAPLNCLGSRGINGFCRPEGEEREDKNIVSEENWSVHGQLTSISQTKNDFLSPYQGANSLLNKEEGGGKPSYSVSSTVFLGRKLSEHSAFFINPELFQGVPFNGQLVGLGGFQNGELQKGAFESPVYYTARAFFRQTLNFGGETKEEESGPNQFKSVVTSQRWVLTFGKLASLDYFDDNTYSHDPRKQFQNFSIFSMGAFGYAADIKGFTFGAVAEWYNQNHIVKVARLALPLIPNNPLLDFSLQKDYADQIEITRFHKIKNQHGALRFILYRQYGLMATYDDAIKTGLKNNSLPDIVQNRKNGTTSWGYGLNAEQAVWDHTGFFTRYSWNPGQTETQTLDISQSFSMGVNIKGSFWSKPSDELGVGFAVNQISAAEVNYLKRGGLTAFIGDGQLNYKPETVFETYYNFSINPKTTLTTDYQKISNPAYNSNRGPINIYGVRLHYEF